MSWDLLIRGGDVVTPDGVRRLDVAVEGGAIVELAAGLAGAARETVDAAGLHVFPGVIDAHVHFNEPGRTDWEGFATGSAALAAGGGTCFFDMPLNSSPPTLDGESFDLKRRAAEASSRTDFALWGGLTPDNLDRMEELAERGVIGFKAFMCDSGIEDFAAADDETLRRGMEIAALLDIPVAVHAEDPALLLAAVTQGGSGAEDFLRSRPLAAELSAIAKAVRIAGESGCDLHVVHLSDATDVLHDAAAAYHTRVTSETCPHYLLLDEHDVLRLGAVAKCAPPLREPSAKDRLWRDLDGGDIDFVASDHSPSPPFMKQGDDFRRIWGGIAGVQSTLATLLSREPALPRDRVAALTASRVADRFHLPLKGRVAAGFDGDFTLVDMSRDYVLTADALLDRHKLSPYVGRKFRGVVRRTIVRGHTVFRDGRTVGDFRGRLITPGGKGATRD
jgi:allantoinase